jgi:uncharacterized membrane protein YkvA (DUF1232 family)
MNKFEIVKSWAKELKRNILVLWFALKNPKTPFLARAVAFITVTYTLSPIDLIPDFIPVLGYIDDIILIPILVWITLKLVPDDVMIQSRQQAQELLAVNQSKPKSYFGLFIILAIWFLVGCIIIKHLI